MSRATVLMGHGLGLLFVNFFDHAAEGEGISASTLSVEISNSGSRVRLCHRAFSGHLVGSFKKCFSHLGHYYSAAMFLSPVRKPILGFK